MAWHTCLQCGKQFKRLGTKARYCSHSCANAANHPCATAICQHCGKLFPAERSGMLYCSTDCYHAASITSSLLTCKRCGKQVLRTLSRIKRGEEYCSPACRIADTPKVSKVCPICHQTFIVNASVSHRYTVCSHQCRVAETKYVACERCGKVFRAEKRLNRHYCSEECRRPPVMVKCATCGHEFRRLPGDTDHTYCSFACYMRSHAETSIERIVRQALTTLGLDYQTQVRVGRYSIDFHVPARNLAIEVDGTYWHRDPTRDQRKDAFLAQRGMAVVRIPERDLDSTETLEVVRRYLAAAVPLPETLQLRLW